MVNNSIEQLHTKDMQQIQLDLGKHPYIKHENPGTRQSHLKNTTSGPQARTCKTAEGNKRAVMRQKKLEQESSEYLLKKEYDPSMMMNINNNYNINNYYVTNRREKSPY